MGRHIRNYNSEVFRFSQEEEAPLDVDSYVNNDPVFLKWTDRLKEALRKGEMLKLDEAKIRRCLYRPFVGKFLYFDHLLNQRRYQQHHVFPTAASEGENVVIG